MALTALVEGAVESVDGKSFSWNLTTTPYALNPPPMRPTIVDGNVDVPFDTVTEIVVSASIALVQPKLVRYG